VNNYEYIIASLPIIRQDGGKDQLLDESKIISEIQSQLSARDQKTLALMLRGYDDATLGESFYQEALKSSNRFIREYFRFDRSVRNTKVKFINTTLGRPLMESVVSPTDDSDYDERPNVESVLAQSDILARERGMDDILWNKIDELTVFSVFDMDLILGIVAKIKIICRWIKLDEQTGREKFRALVEQIRKTR